MYIIVNLYLYNIKYIYKNRIIVPVNNLLKYKLYIILQFKFNLILTFLKLN